MSNVTTVSWFSAGVSSAVATKLACDILDHIIYIHVDDQHPDTLRFVRECEQWFGKPVHILQSPYRDVATAIRCGGGRYMNGPRGASCTKFLKRRVRAEWECDNRFFNTFRYVWGMDAAEASRCDRLCDTMPDAAHVFPLRDKALSKAAAHGILKRAGIKRPAMYDLGYHNNNCVGCVKGGKGYWNKIRVDFPDVFSARALLEREIGGSCINGTFLDELDPDAGRDQGPVLEDCGPLCETVFRDVPAELDPEAAR